MAMVNAMYDGGKRNGWPPAGNSGEQPRARLTVRRKCRAGHDAEKDGQAYQHPEAHHCMFMRLDDQILELDKLAVTIFYHHRRKWLALTVSSPSRTYLAHTRFFLQVFHVASNFTPGLTFNARAARRIKSRNEKSEGNVNKRGNVASGSASRVSFVP